MTRRLLGTLALVATLGAMAFAAETAARKAPPAPRPPADFPIPACPPNC